MQTSTTVGNAQADAIETAIGTAPDLELFGGAALPANCAAGDAGTKYASGTLPSDWLGAASGRVKSKAGTWTITGLPAAGSGSLVRYYRIKKSGTCHLQGLVGLVWAAATAYVVGQQVKNDSGKCYVCTTAGTSAGSGGPTGTGSGITDGTAVWDYAGVCDMTVDNLNVANGQAVTVDTFDVTQGGG